MCCRGVDAVAERVRDDLVGQDPLVPGVGEAHQPVHAAGGLVHGGRGTRLSAAGTESAARPFSSTTGPPVVVNWSPRSGDDRFDGHVGR